MNEKTPDREVRESPGFIRGEALRGEAMEEIDYAARVQAGAAWLDKEKPDWVRTFAGGVMDNLHMRDCRRCVLGHVFGHYRTSPLFKSIPIGDVERYAERAEPLGFSLAHGTANASAAWTGLGVAWTECIGK